MDHGSSTVPVTTKKRNLRLSSRPAAISKQDMPCSFFHCNSTGKCWMSESTLSAWSLSIHVPRGGVWGVFLLEVQYSILKSLISTCVLSYVGSREDWLLDRICES